MNTDRAYKTFVVTFVLFYALNVISLSDSIQNAESFGIHKSPFNPKVLSNINPSVYKPPEYKPNKNAYELL